MPARKHVQGPPAASGLILTLLTAGLLLLLSALGADAFDAEEAFHPMAKAVSAEGALQRFTSGRLAGAYINAWNVSGRFSLFPFGIIHWPRMLHGTLDGAFEIGLGPSFERFNSVHQNFAGLLVDGRYYLVHLGYGRLVPFIGGSIGPGYSDLNVGARENNQLKGPFMASISGEVGVMCFIDEKHGIYAGLKGQHFSNGHLNGGDTNVSLNTPWGMVMGFSWFFR